MIINLLNHIIQFNEQCMDTLIKFANFMHVPEFLQEAVAESINLIPFLFIIFLFIEIFENYFSEKIEKLSLGSKLYGPIIGSALAVIPQCGFSVIATMLYIKRFITLGTLIAVFIATSDEAIPVLLTHPEAHSQIIAIIGVKIAIGVVTGYLIDLIFPTKLNKAPEKIEVCECGCCHNEIHTQVTSIFIHPLKHTFNIFLFILIINCCLSYFFFVSNNTMNNILSTHTILQVFISAIIGLIPNCATSVLLAMLYVKSVINFGVLMAGLTTNAGLGVLVLFKNNDLKDSLKIVAILFVVAIISGLVLQIC